METITIPDAMADPTYQQQQTELARQMADFKAQQDLADAQYTGSYNQTTRKLGRNGDKWDPNLQNGQYGETVNANTNDFAGRGLYNSGEFAKSSSNVDADFNSRLGEIDRARTDFRDTAALSNRNMASQQETVRQQALASAVAGIAAKYGINLDQVGRGEQRQITRAI
jgi:beta-glucosidase/6-phospho-beta-glucosidase/beta-galactosidase